MLFIYLSESFNVYNWFCNKLNANYLAQPTSALYDLLILTWLRMKNGIVSQGYHILSVISTPDVLPGNSVVFHRLSCWAIYIL